MSLNKAQLHFLLENEIINLAEVIDAVIDLNHYVGVGLISLSDDVSRYIIDYPKSKYRRLERTPEEKEVKIFDVKDSFFYTN